MSTLPVIVLCDRKRGSATAWNQAQGKSFCILILHKEKEYSAELPGSAWTQTWSGLKPMGKLVSGRGCSTR